MEQGGETSEGEERKVEQRDALPILLKLQQFSL